MDEDRLTLSPDYGPQPKTQPKRPKRGRERDRWAELDDRLDEAVHDRRYDPYDDRIEGRPRRGEGGVRTPLLVAAVVVAALLCLAFALAPLMAFRALRSAAQYGDVAALQELVDYGAVRQSLRTQIRPASAELAPPSDLLRDPLGTLRRAWEPVSPQADVDAWLGPGALAALTFGRTPSPGAAPAPGAGGGLFGGPIPAVRYWGLERVRLGVKDPAAAGRETVFTFRRNAPFRWRLVGVRLPEPVR